MIAMIRTVLGDRRGVVAIIFALALPVTAGVAGLGVEAGEWYMLKRRAQTAADAAAYAGALEIARSARAQARPVALGESARNGYPDGAPITVTVNIPPVSGPQAGNANAVEVLVAQQQPLRFASLFIPGPQTITARAVASVTQLGNACVLALDRTARRALQTTGNSVVQMNECSLASNSNDAQSMYFSGNSQVSAPTAWSAGGIVQSGSSTPQFPGGTLAFAWPVQDPYAGLTITMPAAPACNNPRALTFNSTTLSPGVYCGGINVNSGSTVVLNPGTYYLDQGDFSVGSNAVVTCACNAAGSGVTIVLTSSRAASRIGSVTINGQARVTLRAPSAPSYPYPGILFFQDRRYSGNTVNHLNGGSNLQLTGAMYFPSSSVDWNGNSTGLGCTQIIADTVTISGDTNLTNTGCAALGLQPISLIFAGLTE
jgi:Flp pilus assembly protein TadG